MIEHNPLQAQRQRPGKPPATIRNGRSLPAKASAVAVLTALALVGCGSSDDDADEANPPTAETVPGDPVDTAATALAAKKDLGKATFRYETFGNQGFWTDALQLPQGIAGAKVTPLDALSLGLNVDATALNPDTAAVLVAEVEKLKKGANPTDSAVLTDPAITLALINQGAVLGVVPFDKNGNRKPLGSAANFDPKDTLDLARGDKVGVTCSLCHTPTDGSVVPKGFGGLKGTVGAPTDGRHAADLDIGSIIAASANPRAYLPLLQLKFSSLMGATIGKTDFAGIEPDATTGLDTNEAVRAYLTGKGSGEEGERNYPVGTFDALPDGIGNGAYTPPFFRTDLAGPWGHSGGFAKLDDFNNFVYTVPLDPTVLATANGQALLKVLAGPVGEEIGTRYQKVLADSGLEGKYPFVKPAKTGIALGDQSGPAGVRVEDAKLEALRTYTDSLQAPAAPVASLDSTLIARGKTVMTEANCTSCHTLDPNAPVMDRIIPITEMYAAYNPAVLYPRAAPFSNVQDSNAGPNPTYDNELVVFNASIRGGVPGFALPLLSDLADKVDFLHDGSVEAEPLAGQTATRLDGARAGLNLLLNPTRTPQAPHPFYVAGSADRNAVVEYLLSR